MTNEELGSIVLGLLLLMTGAHLLGQLFTRMRQPKVVGEILAGILLGPSILGTLAPGFATGVFGADADDPRAVGLSLMYNLGLLLLMFVSGASVRHVLGRENRRPTAWILALGTPLPFLVALLVAPMLPLERFTGPAGSETAVILVFAAATVVTSIPVITKIFLDLGILHTRFASLLLGSAVLEDIVLWGVLSIATAIATATVAATGNSAGGGALTATISSHVAVNAAFVLAALTVAPAILRKLSRASWNRLAQNQPAAWVLAVLLAYVSLAAALDVTLVFAAFLAGCGVVGGMRSTEAERFKAPLDSIGVIAGGLFIPVFFALVGYRLDFSKTFDPLMLVGFLVGTSLACLPAVALGARLAGMRGLDVVNIAITLNARGGTGIVMAGVAFDAKIINAPFFTTLVLTAVLTSQAAGFWLDLVLRRGWPLLSGVDLRRRGLEVASESGSGGEQTPDAVPTGVNGAINGHVRTPEPHPVG